MEITMNIQLPEGMQKKEWFNVKEFAAGVKSTPHAVNQWLRVHPEFTSKYCQNISHGTKMKRWLIFWEGVAIFVAKRNTFNGNRFKQNEPLVTRQLESAKEEVGKMANMTFENATTQIQPMTPIQALLQSVQQMADMEARFQKTEGKVQVLEKKLEEATAIITSPIPVTAGQRQFLNERVRKYCIAHNLPYHIVWRQIHEHVGLIGVHQYHLKHYQAALKYLEKMYNETDLIW